MSPRLPYLQLAAIALLAAACSDSAGPGQPNNPFVYTLTVGCIPPLSGPYVCSPNQTSIARGDTLYIGNFVIDTLGGASGHPMVHASCARSFEIRYQGRLVGTLPPTITCPDSTFDPVAIGLRGTIFVWPVPDTMPTGRYTFTSVWMVSPPFRQSVGITIN